MEPPHSPTTPSHEPWPDHLPDHASQLRHLFKAALVALASSHPSDRQSALDQFNQCSKSLAQRLVRSAATLDPPQPGSKRAVEQEIAKLRHHIRHQRQTIASTRARLNSWFDQLATQSDVAHDVIEARAYGGKLPPGIGIGSPPVTSTSASTARASASAFSAEIWPTAVTVADGDAPAAATSVPASATSVPASATPSVSAASAADSKPGSSAAASDHESSTRMPMDDDQSSAMSGYPSTSGGGMMVGEDEDDDDDDDESSLPSDWEERINAQAEAEVNAAQARTNHIMSDRRSSLSGFVVEDEDTMAPISVVDNVSGISDVVMAEVEQQADPAGAGAASATNQPPIEVAAGDADVDSISLSGLGSELPAGMQTPPVTAAGMAHPADAPAPAAPAPARPQAVQQTLQHPARSLHPFSSANAFLQGDSDSSSEEDDDD